MTDDTQQTLGITLPPHVAEELRRLGMPLASYTQYQLTSAVRAAVVDCRVIDDDAPDNPLDFEDMLELTPDEDHRTTHHPATQEPHETCITGMATAGVGGVAALPGLVGGFVAQLLKERATQAALHLLQPFPSFA